MSEVVEFKNIEEKEIVASTPSKANIEFRSRIEPKVLENVKRKAPELALSMLKDPTVSIEFGRDVVEKLNNLSINLLNEQEDADIPEANAIVDNVLRELDGYQAKYKEKKEPGAVSKFFSKISKKGKESAYDLKAMVRDAKPITARLNEAEGKIQRMEMDIDVNIEKSKQLREMTMNSIDDIALVIAIFEEIIENVSDITLRASKILEEAEKNGEAIVEFEGKKYSIQEFREVLADMVSAESEIEKTWFNWRQKFFLYVLNIASTREIINNSISLKRTAHRVRMDAIPAARTQLTAWQQAARMGETAEMVNKTNEGMERLILGASQGQLDAIEATAKANQRVMLSEDTIMELTDNLKKQFETIVEAEAIGREVRNKNLEIIRNSEKALSSASAEAQSKMITQSMQQISGETLQLKKNETEEGMKKIEKTSSDLADFME